MPERTHYAPGTPSWVDLAAPDLEQAKAFYSGLFGWEAQPSGDPAETGGYHFLLQDGRRVAGVTPIVSEGQPPAWTTYFATADADDAAARARDAGGTVAVEPMAILDQGRMSYLVHPGAGAFGVWEAGRHHGAELVQEPVSLTWVHLLSRDLDGADAFLEAVLGLRPVRQDAGGEPVSLLHVGDDAVAGASPVPGALPEDVPSHWQVYFAVEDCDASAARLAELGGTVTMAPADHPGIGRVALVADPAGAGFGLHTAVG